MQKIAVIGAGVMGGGIAGLIALGGYPVLLYDIVLTEQSDRNYLANQAILKLEQNNILGAKQVKTLIEPCNLEDDLEKLAAVDWIIEVITENLPLKQALYKKIQAHKKPDSFISSNTSTIPLASLIEGFPIEFQAKFFITHFFNPPRHMKLLEVVTHSANSAKDIEYISTFCEEKLGKQVVKCYDSPGFIANRLGCYWLEVGLREAFNLNLRPSLVDQLANKYLGVPRTGVFGLFDLIGLDVMNLISQSLVKTLPKTDEYIKETHTPLPFYQGLLDSGYTGRKGKGGFYRMHTEDNIKQKQELNLLTGQYQNIEKGETKDYTSLVHFFDPKIDDPYAIFMRKILLKLCHYTLMHAEEMASNIFSIDHAMRNGYNWQYGPFELMDLLPPNFLTEHFDQYNFSIPPLLSQTTKRFYQDQKFWSFEAHYEPLPRSLSLNLNKGQILFQSESSQCIDIGDNVLCLKFLTKLNTLNEQIFSDIIEAVTYINKHNKYLVIGSENEHFSAGANLEFFMQLIEKEDYNAIENFIAYGQKAFNSMLESPQKIVAAIGGYALGGGCELLLHAHQRVAYIESYIGLVEAKLDLIPGWGGIKQMLAKNNQNFHKDILLNIWKGKVSNSAVEAKEMGILDANDVIVMNRDHLLHRAKQEALKPKPQLVKVQNLVPTDYLSEFKEQSTPVLEILCNIFKQNDVSQINLLEQKGFIELIKAKSAHEKIAFTLKTGKPPA